MDFRKLVEEDRLGVGVDLSGHVDIIFSGLLQNVRKVQDIHLGEYDVAVFSGLKHIDRALGDVMKPKVMSRLALLYN